MTIQIIKATKQIYNEVYNEVYKEINFKSVPFLIILFLTFMILFGCTNITIFAADNLSYLLLVILLFINQIFLYYNNNQYKIYIILTSLLMTFALLYVIYIKRIYDKEKQIINYSFFLIPEDIPPTAFMTPTLGPENT
jgi:hypothetical protein